MSTATGCGWTCGKCGRTGLTSVTVLGGINLCALCNHEMQLAAKATPMGWPPVTHLPAPGERCTACGHRRDIPLDGPGSHAWDLAEQRAQTKRADEAEAKVTALEAEIARLRALAASAPGTEGARSDGAADPGGAPRGLTSPERAELRSMGEGWAGTDGRTKEATEAWNAAGQHLLAFLDRRPPQPRLGCGEVALAAPASPGPEEAPDLARVEGLVDAFGDAAESAAFHDAGPSVRAAAESSAAAAEARTALLDAIRSLARREEALRDALRGCVEQMERVEWHEGAWCVARCRGFLKRHGFEDHECKEPCKYEAALSRARALLSPGASPGGEADAWVIECRDKPRDFALFWAPDRRGYTTDLSKAGRYTEAEAKKQERSRDIDHAFRLSDVMPHAGPRVDAAVMYRIKTAPPATVSPPAGHDGDKEGGR